MMKSMICSVTANNVANDEVTWDFILVSRGEFRTRECMQLKYFLPNQCCIYR